MFISVLVLIPLPRRDDLSMVYAYEYVSYTYHGFGIISGLHCKAHIPIIVVPKVAA